jgi:hypothetical protein
LEIDMDVVQERENLFGSSYDGLEPQEVVSLLIKAGEWLRLATMDGPAADAAMRELHRRLFPLLDDSAEQHWRSLWDEVDINSAAEVRGGQFLTGLHGFAFYGLRPDFRFFGIDAGDVLKAMEAYVGQGRSLVDAIPSGWPEAAQTRATVFAAEARLRLDTGRNVTPEQLAALGRIALKSLRNLLAPKGGGGDLSTNSAGEIAAQEALRWLGGRSDFLPSLWQVEGGNWGRESPAEQPELGEVVFVPVAKDGTFFDPVTCGRHGRYTIGPKGAEEAVDNYREALARLSRMPTPHWRRPNKLGNWGIVAGVGWQRKVLDELLASDAEAA